MTLATSALEVAKYLGRVSAAGTEISDLETEIKSEIGETIRFYNRQKYALTEFRGFTLTTASGAVWYSSVDLTSGDGDQSSTDRTAVDVKDILAMTYLRENTTSGATYDLKRLPYREFERVYEGTTANASPTYYTIYAGQVGLFPTPDAVYSIYGSGHVKPAVPTEDSDTSVWLSECEEMILAGAAKRVCLKYLRDTERAAEFAALERSAQTALTGEHVSKSATGRVRVCD